MDNFGRRRSDLFSDPSPFLLGIVAFDLKLKVVNPAWEKFLGYAREELLDRPLSKFVNNAEHMILLALVNPRTVAGNAGPVEFSLRCKDGTYRGYVWERRPIPAEQAMFISGKDITDQKRMEVTANLHAYLRARNND
jgi:PAS domain S-box-containing protein